MKTITLTDEELKELKGLLNVAISVSTFYIKDCTNSIAIIAKTNTMPNKIKIIIL